MAKDQTPTGDAAIDFLAVAFSRFQTAQTAEEARRRLGLVDLDFLNLKQWDDEIWRQRNVTGFERPCLVIDQIGEPYRHRIGQMRRSRPAITVSPVDDKADLETAEIFQGLIRHVEQTGIAKPARDEAFKGAVGPGWGFYRLLTDYAGPDTYDQEVSYQVIEDAYRVFSDPSHLLSQPKLCRWRLVVEDVPKEEFERRYPGVPSTSQGGFEATGLRQPDWYPQGSVRVADYYYIEDVPDGELCLLSDGRSLKKDQADVIIKASGGALTCLSTRPVTTPKVKLAKITGAAILEGNDDKTAGRDQIWPWIPVVPVVGEELTVNGVTTPRGMVRAAIDAQRQYNYQASELVLELAMSPRAKVILAEGQDEGYEDQFSGMNIRLLDAIRYKPTSLNGLLVGPPQVAHFTDSVKIQAIVVALNQAKSDCRTTTGWYDSSDPSRKNTDQSGKAILARKEAQDEGSVNFTENFSQSLGFEAALLVGADGRKGALAQLYPPGRVARVLGIDGTAEHVTLGQPYAVDPKQGRRPLQPGEQFQQGLHQVYDLNVGRYDFVVSVGASYATRRQETAQYDMDLMKLLPPEMAAACAPTMVRNTDGPGHEELADALERALPPQLRADAEDQPQVDPRVQQQMGQAQQAIQVLTQELNKLHDEQAAETIQLASKERIVKMQEDTKLLIAEFETKTSQRNAEIDAIRAQYEQLNSQVADMAAQHAAQAHEAATQASDQQHEAEMARLNAAHAAGAAQQQADLQPPPDAGAGA